MSLLVFLFLLFCYLLSGYGILNLFGLRLRKAYTITLSLLLGVAVASFIPFLLQLCYIVLTGTTVFGSLTLVALLLNIPAIRRSCKTGFLRQVRQGDIQALRQTLREILPTLRRRLFPRSFRILPYEIPYLMIIGFLVFVSVWRCYYLPPTSRDALSGPEAIAEYAVREHTMINSFFQVDLWSTNNQFKSPFLISLQMIYKMAGFPFGQVWLSIVFISFTIFLYQAMKEKVHPIIAGLLLLLFMMTPEIYAYTFMILYDYSNMVFFFLGLYFLFGYFNNKSPSFFYFAGLLLGIATYIRSETLVLAALFLPVILLAQYKQFTVKKMIQANLLFFLPSFIGYYIPSGLYIKYYLPVHYDIGGLVNDHLSNWNPLFQRYSDIVTRLMTSQLGIQLWGYILYIGAFLFLAELLFFRRFNKDARNWLYAIGVLYLGLGLLGFLLPMVNLGETTKRGLFKMMPLVIFYLANNELLMRLSRRISHWEVLPPQDRASAAAATGGLKPAKTTVKAVSGSAKGQQRRK